MVRLTQNQIIKELKLAGIARLIALNYDVVTDEVPVEDVFDSIAYNESFTLQDVSVAMKKYSGRSIGNMESEISRLVQDIIAAPPAFTPLEDFDIIDPGHCYDLPIYDVVPGIGIVPREGPGQQIKFVRGAMGSDRPKKEGTIHEPIIAMLVHDLEGKQGEVAHEETECAIRCLKNALNHLRARKIDRITRNVLGTDKV